MSLHVAPDGWIDAARRIHSPNCDARPVEASVELLVIHNISLPPGEFGGDSIERLFTNRLDPDAHPYFKSLAGVRVSAHFLIDRAGELTHFVACGERAWHAGASRWRGRERCNDYSVGVELEGTDLITYTDRQYARLAALTRALLVAYPIRSIAGHSEVAPNRKTDPGPGFDWARYLVAIAYTH